MHRKRRAAGLWIIGLLICSAAVPWAYARRIQDSPPTHARPSGLDNADPASTTDIIMHDIGNVRFTIANYGETGNPNTVPGFKGFKFPINSGSDFLFSAGIWVGAIVNDQRLVSTATDGDNGTGEFYPVHIFSVPASNSGQEPDWHLSFKTLDSFGDRSMVFGAKDLDDDGDWSASTDDLDGSGNPSKNYDGGHGIVGFDDDNDDLIDEEIVNGIDDDGDGDIDEDTDASGDINHDGNCNYDPEPHIDEDPAGDMSADYLDNDFDGLVDGEDSDFDGDALPGFLDDDGDGLDDEDGVARGAQEYYAVFQDNIEATYVSSPDVDGHTPLNIQISQRTYAFPEDYAADFILLDYRIRNVGPLPLQNVFVAMFSDPDIGGQGEGGDAASLDDYNYYDPERLMMVQYDDQSDADGAGPGVFAIRVVKTPVALDQLKVTFANFERVSGGDPETNADKYNLIESGDISEAATAPGDWRMLLSFGAAAGDGFSLAPGEELPITVAFIAGDDTADVGTNAEWALAMYLNDFQGPSAPDAPVYALDIYSDRVRVRWMNNAEASVDAITAEADFEGYAIERSTGQTTWQTIVSYDKIDTLEVPFEWQNYNLGMPVDTVRLNDTLWYYYEDMNLIPGHTYEYVVRSFDTGVLGAGVLYSPRTGNTRQAIIAQAQQAAATSLSGIYVYPNPYKGSHAGEFVPVPNENSGALEFVRQLYFRGLPTNTVPNKCIIRIFSLAGDHLQTLNHQNGTEQDVWNLMTRHNQEIVSGIYYYTVEYGSETFIDKFVVIK